MVSDDRESYPSTELLFKLILTTSSSYRYALYFGSRGAKVVVNDVSQEAAQKVVDEIKQGQSRCPILLSCRPFC